MMAAKLGQADMVDLLVGAGADVNACAQVRFSH